MKYLRGNLTKDVEHLYPEKYKTLCEKFKIYTNGEVEEDPKLIYRFNTITVRIPEGCFVLFLETDKLTLTFIGNPEEPKQLQQQKNYMILRLIIKPLFSTECSIGVNANQDRDPHIYGTIIISDGVQRQCSGETIV